MGQSLKMAWNSIISSKLRSFLTMLGIIIGVIALVVLVSLARGATSSVTDAISSMGTNTLSVTISDDSGQPVKWTDMSEIESVSHISEAAPTASESVTAVSGRNSETVSVTGTTAAYLDIEGLTLDSGRFLKSTDVNNHTAVLVINESFASDILGVQNTKDAIGMTADLNGIPYTVIGVLQSDSSISIRGMASYEAYIPYTSLMRLSDNVSSVTSFVACADSDENLDAAESALTSWLQERFGNDEDAFTLTDMSTVADTLSSVSNTLALMLGGIAAISLLVGGIGIMNIMMVSVTERTREIGIRKAIGASEASIMIQFLLEALILSLLGALLGIAGSFLTLRIIGLVGGTYYSVDRTAALTAVLFSMGIGLIFGLYPARKAARKRPIEALHYAG